MITPDLVNGAFEATGSIFTWMNVARVCRDKGHAGLYVPAIAFFMSWGLWNLFFYPHLHQWVSFAGGVSLVIANVVWVTMLVWFGPVQKKDW